LFPAKQTKLDTPFAETQNDRRAAEEPHSRGAVSTLSATSKTSIDGLFAPRLSEQGP